MKKWELINKEQKIIRQLADKEQTEKIIKILLENRGIKTEKERETFLTPQDPYTLTSKQVGIDPKQLERAVKRIQKAIKERQKIIVYGDYDSDGVCATAIMWETLWKLKADALPFIPTRDEGYGMKVEKLDEFKKEGVGLIITVDNGIVSYSQTQHAKEIGLDMVITDHHLPGKGELEAFAVVHTTQLCGAGVSWFVANQLRKTDLDLVTTGTVTDLMPLVGINRAIVYHGLGHLQKTRRLGLQELFKAAAIVPEKIGTYEIGYIIGPRLNAAGRMEDPMDALRLVCTPKDQQALDLAKKLDQQNRERQSLMEVMTLQAKEMWLKEDGKSKLIFVSSESWEHGIVGLVAGKLVEEFSRPAVVISWGKEYCRASARSINGFNIVEAIRTCEDFLEASGGHSMAAGFTVATDKLEQVQKKLISLANQQLTEEDLQPKIKIDLELDFSSLTLELYQAIKKLEPFGLGNYQPVFLTRGLRVIDARTVGATGKHLKLNLADQKNSGSSAVIGAIGFGMGDLYQKLSPETEVDLVYTLEMDEWDGNKKLQLKVKDIKLI